MKGRMMMLAIFCMCVIAGLLGYARMLGFIIMGSDRAWRSARSFDRVANVAIGGDEHETVSSHANRSALEGQRWGCVLCALLNKIEQDHCAKSAGV